MPAPMIALYLLALLVIGFFLWRRYKKRERVKRKSWNVIDDLHNGSLSPAAYAATLSHLIYYVEVERELTPDFSLLEKIRDTTVNEYYVVKDILAVDDRQYMVIADTLTYKSFPGAVQHELQQQFTNMLYTSHILIRQDSSTRMSCFAAKPDDDVHEYHMLDFSKYLIRLVNNVAYDFAIPPRYSL
ncbi:hypothetical protein CJD36_004305 [Flavipsychrobacter stenotrophus]|uniref:Uncharacterized protein n=1 Tax=Flavipsychrobacter stenotrophus TaxID=2077091 RepID=A0A2S7T188_9BACT|nr:hypothetical protein [Flavipsychrobacter stenotrophus]PQJ12973.1 hypothetical protein CJD36_004305 [Flavipsychrobacter stenotrophus]